MPNPKIANIALLSDTILDGVAATLADPTIIDWNIEPSKLTVIYEDSSDATRVKAMLGDYSFIEDRGDELHIIGDPVKLDTLADMIDHHWE